jgi:hypothetical protein
MDFFSCFVAFFEYLNFKGFFYFEKQMDNQLQYGSLKGKNNNITKIVLMIFKTSKSLFEYS